jgi:hypothetical protein
MKGTRPANLGRHEQAMTQSIHDNDVLGYSVDIEAKTIVLHTEFRGRGQPFERTDVRFDGVLGYHFRDSLGGILSGIEQVDIAHIVAHYAKLFEAGARHAWPFQSCTGDPADYVRSAGASAFEVKSAIGFDGFVACKAMTIEALPTRS